METGALIIETKDRFNLTDLLELELVIGGGFIIYDRFAIENVAHDEITKLISFTL